MKENLKSARDTNVTIARRESLSAQDNNVTIEFQSILKCTRYQQDNPMKENPIRAPDTNITIE